MVGLELRSGYWSVVERLRVLSYLDLEPEQPSMAHGDHAARVGIDAPVHRLCDSPRGEKMTQAQRTAGAALLIHHA